MSGTRELKQLILMIDEHRQNIGNSQYSFPLDTEPREVLQRFSAAIPRMRPAAFKRIKEHWLTDLRFATRPSEIEEQTADYVWSLVYPLRREQECTEATFPARIAVLRDAFFDEAEGIDVTGHTQVQTWVKQRALLQFQHEEDALALFYRQRREKEVFERNL